MHTLRSDCQGLTLLPLLTPTVDTMYCDVVLIACHETSQFMLCDSGSGDVQKSPILTSPESSTQERVETEGRPEEMNDYIQLHN